VQHDNHILIYYQEEYLNHLRNLISKGISGQVSNDDVDMRNVYEECFYKTMYFEQINCNKLCLHQAKNKLRYACNK